MLYFAIAIMLVISVYVYDMHSNTNKKLSCYWGICILLTCIAGLRYRLGIDTIGYMVSYEEDIPTLADFWKEWQSDNFTFEFGSTLFFSICKTITKSWLLPQFLIALITNISIFKFALKNSNYPFCVILFYFLIFYFDICFETLRQALALSVALYAFEYLKEKAYWKYYALCIVALLFHNISVILFVIPLLQFKFNYKVSTLIIVCCFLFTGLLSTLFQDVISVFETYGSAMMAKKAENYIEGDVWGIKTTLGRNRNMLFYIGSFLFEIAPVIFINYLFGKCEQKSQHRYFTPFIVIWSIAVATKSTLPIMYRVQEFMLPVMCIIFAEILSIIRCDKVYIRKAIIFYTFVCIIFYWNYKRFYKVQEGVHTLPRIVSYTPYASYFTEQTDSKREKFYSEVDATGSR